MELKITPSHNHNLVVTTYNINFLVKAWLNKLNFNSEFQSEKSTHKAMDSTIQAGYNTKKRRVGTLIQNLGVPKPVTEPLTQQSPTRGNSGL